MNFSSSIEENKMPRTTTYKVVTPFYSYAAICFLVSTILLFIASSDIYSHYFQPKLLAIVHLMALGWGTMIILGASHQLIPVIIESSLYSNKLGYATFILLALGIPLLVFDFYEFKMSLFAKWGGRLIILSVITYLVNIYKSIKNSNKENVHAVFIFTATMWLLVTVSVGLMLVYNFTFNFFNIKSVDFLSLHAHVGIVGWFLLLIVGVGSRLIPMFLISKYSNPKSLWSIFYLINFGLLLFILFFIFYPVKVIFLLPFILLIAAIALFASYCIKAYKLRIRKKLDEQMKLSMLSILFLILPIILLTIIMSIIIIFSKENISLIILYGFIIFFGWITSIILGMTFKTLPFIIWNKVYHNKSLIQKSPSPKELFSNSIFKVMLFVYLLGILIFIISFLLHLLVLIKIAVGLLIIAAFLYNWNVIKLLFHKPNFK